MTQPAKRASSPRANLLTHGATARRRGCEGALDIPETRYATTVDGVSIKVSLIAGTSIWSESNSFGRGGTREPIRSERREVVAGAKVWRREKPWR